MLPVEPLEDLLTSLCTLRVIQDIKDVVLHQSKLSCICYAEKGKKQAEVCEGYHIVWKVWYIFYLIQPILLTLVASLQFSRMYRNYQLQQTYVLNPHHYLLTAQNASSMSITFHQLLLSDTLPLTLDLKHIQSYIDESENQNIINQTKQGYQLYLDNNLLQIRMKDSVESISNIQKMQYLSMVQMVNLVSLDFAIAVKQLQANQKHATMGHMNNCNKFYGALLGVNKEEVIVPFIEKGQNKIHYYDIHFGRVFAKGQSKGELVKRRKQGKNQSQLLSDEEAFRRFILYLMAVLSSKNIAEVMNQIARIRSDCVDEEDVKQWKEKIKHETMAILLERCLNRSEEYNIHIFKKQLELLIDRYRMKGQEPAQSSKKIELIPEKLKVKQHRPLLVSRDQKNRLSKSFIDPSKTSFHSLAGPVAQRGRQGRRDSGTRLKYSKSQISLNKSTSSSKNRKFKKGTLSLFKESKIIPRNNNSFYGEQSKSSLMNSSSILGKSTNFNFGGMNSATSNWFNMSAMQSQDLSGKLRNFKKVSNPATLTANHTAKNSKVDLVQPPELKKDISLDEREQRLFAKLKSRANAMLQQKEALKHQNIEPVKEKAVVQDQFTMKEKQINDKFIEQDTKQNKREVSLHQENVQVEQQEIKKEIKNNKLLKQPDLKDQVTSNKQKIQTKEDKKTAKSQSPLTQRKNSTKHIAKDQSFKIKSQSPLLTRKNSSKLTKLQKGVKAAHIIKKGKQNEHNYADQIQDINLHKIQTVKSTKNKPDPKPSSKRQQIQTTDADQLQKSNKQDLKAPLSKKKVVILSQQQKSFQVKHFELFLKFCNQNKNHITTLPLSNTLTYLINFLYYKTLLENSHSENKNIYKQLVSLIERKQQKISAQDKGQYLMYRVDSGSLWTKVSLLKNTEKDIVSNLQNFTSGKETVQCQQQLYEFETLTKEGCTLLQTLLKDLYIYINSNKAMLINKSSFSILLELGQLLTVTLIMSLQRSKYYRVLSQLQYSALFTIYTFQFKQSEDEFLRDYRKKAAEKDLTYFSVQEEYSNMQNWLEMYK